MGLGGCRERGRGRGFPLSELGPPCPLVSALPLSEVQPRQVGGCPEWVIGGPWGPSQGQGGAALLSKTSRPVPGTSHNPSLVILPEEWGSQQHVTDEETEAQRASLEVTQLRTGEVRFKPSPGVFSPLLVYTPPSWGQCHLEFSDSHSGDGTSGVAASGHPHMSCLHWQTGRKARTGRQGEAYPDFPLLPGMPSSLLPQAPTPAQPLVRHV